LQAVEGRFETLVIARAGAAADEREDLVGRRCHQARGAEAVVASLDDLAGRPDQDIGVPDGRHSVFGHGLHPDRHRAGTIIDRCGAGRLGEAEEGIGHEVLRIAGREIAGEGAKQFELLPLRCAGSRHGWRSAAVGATRDIVVPLGRQDRSSAGIGRGLLGAAVRPGLQIVDRIDNAATELAIGGAGAVGAVFLERPAGQAKEARGFGSSQIAWRQVGGRRGHDRASVVLGTTAGYRRFDGSTVAEKARRGGVRRRDGGFAPSSWQRMVTVEEGAIGALHVLHAFAETPHDGVALGHGFPCCGADVIGTKNDLGDLLEGRAGPTPVDHPQHLPEIVPAVRGDAQVFDGSPPVYGVRESSDRIETILQEAVKKGYGCDRSRRYLRARAQGWKPMYTDIDEEEMALGCSECIGLGQEK